MADVRPFRAVRYARPSAAVTAPPYDVVDDATRESLAARDPHNVVHLTLEPDADLAGERFRRWLADGVLVRDEQPAVWWLEQDFVGPDGVARTRAGTVASLRAEPYATGAVLPHERTHAEPIAGRLRLLRATRAQLEPIFLLHDGRPPLERPDRPPDLEVDATRLWRIEEGSVTPFFEGVQLLVADGHHRYETAVAFAAEDGADRLMAVLVSTSDPGVQIFPTHRVFSERPEIDPPGEPFATLDQGLAALSREPAGSAAAVFVRGDDARLVRGSDGELDVELVDRFGHQGIAYTPDLGEVVRRLRGGGEPDCAFVLRPLRIEDVFDRARRGQTLPQKATYFFPKLVSGLLFHPVDA